MQSLQFIGLDPGDFKKDLVNTIKQILFSIEEQKKPCKSTDLLTRDEVAILLKASPATIYRWTKNGRLKSYGLGNRVYYKRHEIEESLISLNPTNHE